MPTAAQRPVIEAIIAVHDPRRPVGRAIASILAQRAQLARHGAELMVSVIVHNTDIGPVRAALEPGLAEQVRWSHLVDGIASPAGPFNQGLDEATGELLTTIGSDDVLEPGSLAAWFDRARRTRADAVVAALRTPEGIVTTPYLRPSRRDVLDPVRDRLAYRTAPLGLLRRESLQRIGFRYTQGGHLNGEDIEPGLRLWFRGGRIAYPYGAPCYRVTDDMGASRATAALGPMSRELGFLVPLLEQPWLRRVDGAEREAIATKLARAQIRGAVGRRVLAAEAASPEAWTPVDADVTAQMLEGLRALSGTGLAALAAAETALLEGAARAADAEELMACAARERSAPRRDRVLPATLRAALARDARPRMFVSQQISQRTGVFAHPDAPA